MNRGNCFLVRLFQGADCSPTRPRRAMSRTHYGIDGPLERTTENKAWREVLPAPVAPRPTRSFLVGVEERSKGIGLDNTDGDGAWSAEMAPSVLRNDVDRDDGRPSRRGRWRPSRRGHWRPSCKRTLAPESPRALAPE